MASREKVINQIAIGKEKANKAQKDSSNDKKGLNESDYPASIEDYFKQMLDRFEAVEQNQYKKIDKDIGDVLHQVYRVKYDGTKKLSKEIFSIMDKDLGTKKTIQQAKTYKKLLAAI